MSLNYIRQTYGVPAAKGGRVRYTGGDEPCLGTITGADGPYVKIRLDRNSYSYPHHPTWELEYLDCDSGSGPSGRRHEVAPGEAPQSGGEAASPKCPAQTPPPRKSA